MALKRHCNKDLTCAAIRLGSISMSEQIMSTIEVLSAKVKTKEEEANSLKKLVNQLCVELGQPIRYENISDVSQGISSLRSDQFYGQALSTAVRNYLEMRKVANLGAATVAEIFKALRDGGFKSETKDEENAKNTLRIALRKNSSIFHRLPNGEYGLFAWYPSAKPQSSKEEEDGEKESGAKTKGTKKNKTGPRRGKAENKGNAVSYDQIRQVIFKTAGNFQVSDIEAAIKKDFPSQELRAGSVSSMIFILKKKGLLRAVPATQGKKRMAYSTA